MAALVNEQRMLEKKNFKEKKCDPFALVLMMWTQLTQRFLYVSEKKTLGTCRLIEFCFMERKVLSEILIPHSVCISQCPQNDCLVTSARKAVYSHACPSVGKSFLLNFITDN